MVGNHTVRTIREANGKLANFDDVRVTRTVVRYLNTISNICYNVYVHAQTILDPYKYVIIKFRCALLLPNIFSCDYLRREVMCGSSALGL